MAHNRMHFFECSSIILFVRGIVLCVNLSFLGDRYDEEPSRYDDIPRDRSRGQLNDIDEWNDGRKNIAEEALGKVKDFWNKARGFDEPPDYG